MPAYRLVVFRDHNSYTHGDLLFHMRDAASSHPEVFSDQDKMGRLYEFLNQRLIPHHFEALTTEIEINGNTTYYDVMIVLHVPDPRHAFEIRLNFNFLPMRPDWREIFTAGQERPPEWWRE